MILATTKHRILQYTNFKCISKTEFYATTGIKRGLLDSDKLNATVPDTALAKITASYPDINIVWLITGAGKMLQSELPSSMPSDHVLLEYLREKDKKIETLTTEVARLQAEIHVLKKDPTPENQPEKRVG